MVRLIRYGTTNGRRAFFELKNFSWVSEMEKHTSAIQAELHLLLKNLDEIPNFHDVSKEQKVISQDDKWKTFFLYLYGHSIKKNIDLCPVTNEILKKIPNMRTAMFSIMAPGTNIPIHCGITNGVLRYHLSLKVPKSGSCGIEVAGELYRWTEEGRSVIFDDSLPHRAWNDSSEARVVLFVDFERPLPFVFKQLNRLNLFLLKKSESVLEAVDQA